MNNADSVSDYVSKKISWLTSSLPNMDAKHRAILAKLRRGVGSKPGEMPELWEVTLAELPEGLLSKDGTPTWGEHAIHTALTLFALHQQGKTESVHQKGISFGTVVRKLSQLNANNEQTITRRFDAVLTSKDFVEFSRHARGLIKLAKASNVSFDYPRFAKELYWYQNPEHRKAIMFKWGQDFWAPLKDNDNQEKGE